MAQIVRVVRGNLPTTAAGTVDLTSTGLGTVTGAIIVMCRANTTDNPAANAMMSVGLWDGTNQRAVSEFSLDNATSSDTSRSSDDALCLIAHTIGVTEATYTVSNITDGIRITMSVDATGLAFYATALLISGVSCAVGTIALNATQDATTESASLGFAPKLIFFTSIGLTAADNVRAGQGAFSFGLASDAPLHRAAANFWRDARPGGEEATQLYSETRDIGVVSAGVLLCSGEVTTFGADTFTLTTRDAASSSQLAFYLALGGADLSYEVETFDTRTTTGDTVLSTAITPEAFLALFTTNASTTIAADFEANGFSIGLADANGQFSHNVFVEDAADPTNNGSVAQAAAAIDLDSAAAGSRVDLCSGTVALNAADVTLSYSVVDGTARKAFGIVFGPAAAVGNGAARHYYAQH